MLVVSSFVLRHQDQRLIDRLSLAAGATSQRLEVTQFFELVEKEFLGSDNAAMEGRKWNKGGGEA